MAEVTYLIGAGASANVIPVVAGIGDSIKIVIEDFYQLLNRNPIKEHPDIQLTDTKNQYHIQRIIADLKWLETNNAMHSSIDTFAKKLYLTGSLELNKLKLILSFYFTYLQIKNHPDKRYDNFWASVLKFNGFLPKKVKILSWNYDFQLEQSYMNMSKSDNINAAQQWLEILNYNQDSHTYEDHGFGIVKLNGSAKINHPIIGNNLYMFDGSQSSTTSDTLQQLIDRYIKINGEIGVASKLSFAWETNTRHLKNTLSPFLAKTEVVAIIGYSFPFFNREIDIELFGMMEKLRLIYIQDMDPEGIQERLIEIFEDNDMPQFKLVKNVGQFVFPKELEI